MFRVIVVCYVIGFVSCQIWLNSTISDIEINGTIVRVNELVTNSDIVSEVELATASTQDVSLNRISTEDFILNDRQCPRGSSKPCVVKCCPLGESIEISKVCEPSSLKFQVIFFDENGESNATADDYDYVVGNPCRDDRFRLEPRYDSNDEFHVLRSGFLWAPYLYPDELSPNEYCLEVFQDPETGEEEVLPLICFTDSPSDDNPSSPLQFILYPIGLLISVPFLIVTMLVYGLIPELRDLHGKTLICHVLCLTVAYIFLAAVQLGGEKLNQKMCIGVAFVIQFSFLACFSWLNALSFNTWWNVEANKKLQRPSHPSPRKRCWGYELLENDDVNMPKATERKVFILYSLFAWCCPLVLLVVSVVFDLMPIIPSSYLKPNFGDNKCWFSSADAELQYFYGPVAVSICINIVLFLFTACRICSHRRATRPKPRQIFRNCLCLFGMMGINWVMEIVSWFTGGPDQIWYVTDIINTLQGLIIFLIFVLEPRVRVCVWDQWGPQLSQILCRKQPHHASVPYHTPEDAAVRINM